MFGAGLARGADADGKAVWLVSRGMATQVPLAGGARRSDRLPPKTRLVADTPYGLIGAAGTIPTRRWRRTG